MLAFDAVLHSESSCATDAVREQLSMHALPWQTVTRVFGQKDMNKFVPTTFDSPAHDSLYKLLLACSSR